MALPLSTSCSISEAAMPLFSFAGVLFMNEPALRPAQELEEAALLKESNT